MKVNARITNAENNYFNSAKAKIFPYLNFSITPAIIAALLPKCPLCLAAYLSIFGVFGVSPLQYGVWIVPAMLFFSALTIVLLFWQTRRSGKYLPFFLGLIALLFIYSGKFWLDSSLLIYAGIAVLLVSSLWLSIAGRNRTSTCHKC